MITALSTWSMCRFAIKRNGTNSMNEQLSRNKLKSLLMSQRAWRWSGKMDWYRTTTTCFIWTGEQNLWQRLTVCNFEITCRMYYFSLADRTFQDLTQYPVFPWIISDYHSDEIDLNDSEYYRDLTKPIGALNNERLQRLKERFEEMDEPKWVSGC